MESGKRYLVNAYIACIVLFYLPSITAIGIFCPSHSSDLRADDIADRSILTSAGELIKIEEYDSAVVLLESIQAEGDSTAQTLYLLGLAHDMNDNIPKALEYYCRAVKADSLYWPPYKGLGYLFDIFARYDSMNWYLGRVLRLSPFPESIYYDYGYSFDMLGNDDSALYYYHRALDFDSLDSQALLNIGAIWGKLENLDSAAYYTRRSVELEPGEAIACYNLAEILSEERKPEEAIDMFQKALAIDPGIIAAKKRLGELYEIMGDSAMSRIYFQEFIATAPIIYSQDIEAVKTKLKETR